MSNTSDTLNSDKKDPDSQSPDISSNTAEPPNIFLERVRSQSCYRTLRIVLVLGVVFAILTLFVLLCRNLSIAAQTWNGDGTITVLSFIGFIAGIVLVMAAWQALVLFVDIGDILIEQNRKK